MIKRFLGIGVSLLLAGCGGGGGGSNPPPPPPPDTSAPDTTLATTPAALTNATSATFTFSSSETGTFQARVDGGVYATVTSPHTLSNLAHGSHTFEVRARDAAGNEDQTPAFFAWAVDTIAPDTAITSAPPASGSGTTIGATFVVAGEPGGTLEASLDGAPFAIVTSPHGVTGIADGNHSIQFRARDAAGNVDASPATATWTVDSAPTVVRLQFPTPNFYTDGPTVTVRGTAHDPGGVGAILVNGVAAQTSDAYAHWKAAITVPLGTTAVNVSATDGAGRTEVVGTVATMVNRGVFVNRAMGIGYDAARGRVIQVDVRTGAVVTVDRTDGIVRMLSSGPVPGTAPGSGLRDLVVDAARDRAIVIDAANNQLVGVDLATGVRTVVSASTGVGSATHVGNAFHLTLDTAGQRAYASVWAGSAVSATILRIDLSNGARSVVSSAVVGGGDALLEPRGIVFDDVSNPAAPRLLVGSSSFDFAQRGLYAVDLATGNRSRFSGGTTGTGDQLHGFYGMALDPPRQRLIVEQGINDFAAVSLASGDRTPMSFFRQTIGGSSFAYLAFDAANQRLFTTYTNGIVAEFDVQAQTSRLLLGSNLRVPFNLLGNQFALAIEQPGGTPASLLTLGTGYPNNVSRLNFATGEIERVSSSDFPGTGPAMIDAMDMVLDRRTAASPGAVLTLHGVLSDKVLSINLATGDRTLLAGGVVGSLSLPRKMALDAANNRVVFTRFGGVSAVDLASGNISPISSNPQSGASLVFAEHIVLEPVVNSTRALVGQPGQPGIIAVDLATGLHSVFDTVIDGHPGPMFVDPTRPRLFVTNAGTPSNLTSIPLAFDGSSRLHISGPSAISGIVRGTGPPQLDPTSLDIDVANEVAFVATGGNASVVAIDLQSGDRVVIAR